jgi:hypothetical protein
MEITLVKSLNGGDPDVIQSRGLHVPDYSGLSDLQVSDYSEVNDLQVPSQG